MTESNRSRNRHSSLIDCEKVYKSKVSKYKSIETLLKTDYRIWFIHRKIARYKNKLTKLYFSAFDDFRFRMPKKFLFLAAEVPLRSTVLLGEGIDWGEWLVESEDEERVSSLDSTRYF